MYVTLYSGRHIRRRNLQYKHMENCPNCGKPMAECTCNKATGETCATCGKPMAECTCNAAPSAPAAQ